MSKYKAIKVSGKKYDEHRYKMEIRLGRKLKRNEIVHHKDEDKSNNDIDNLEIMSLSEHSKLHRCGKKSSEETKIKIQKYARSTRSSAKLIIEQVKEVKLLLSQGIKQIDVANKYQVSKFTIHRIKKGLCSYWIK